MYRVSDLQTGLLNLVGWRQNHNVSEFTIGSSLLASSSGLYYQDVHPLLTLNNIKAVAPKFEDITYPTWDSGTAYTLFDRVTYSSVNYRSKSTNTDKQPDLNPDDWEIFDAFSEWLENKTKASIVKAVEAVWSGKIANMTAKNVLEHKTLFNGTGRLSDIITNGNYMVGFEIIPIRAEGVTLKVDKIGAQFNTDEDVILYLFHSSQEDPVKTIVLSKSKANSLEWVTPDEDIYLPYLSDTTDAGGSWFLVYDQRAIEAVSTKAINKTKDWSKRPCGSCDRAEYAAYNIWSKYLEVHPVKNGSAFDSGNPKLFDVQNNLYDVYTNYGLNLQITLECDVTDLLLEQKRSLANVIGLQVAIDMLRELAYNAEANVNRNAVNAARRDILYELDGDTASFKKSGLVYRMDQAIKALSLDLNRLSRICYSCRNKGVRHRTIGG